LRLLLDVHFSDKRIGAPLRSVGYDVLAVETDHELREMDDEPLLELAAMQQRVVVTLNAKDFIPITARWASNGRGHAGCILVPSSVGNRNYGKIIIGVQRLLAGQTQKDWVDRVQWLLPEKGKN
jgi:predicted nuclease of predicted toxin-antitoxin system